VFTDSKEGLLFEAGNETELAKQLGTLLTDSKSYTQLTTAAYEKVQQSYTWDKQIKKYHELFKQHEQ
jgi:glycosyltransferase involved in cell wall biosynthesis